MAINIPLKHDDRLSPEQFKAVIIGKGWTYKELSNHWGITPVWLSNLARDPERSSHYDDAVMGLPVKRYLARSLKRRQSAAAAYVSFAGSKLKRTSYANRYHGQLVLGAIVAVMEDVGSLAEVGMRGCVFSVTTVEGAEEYGVIFENGAYDWFSCDYIDAHLVLTGLYDSGLSGYQFKTEDDLKRDFSNHRFRYSL